MTRAERVLLYGVTLGLCLIAILTGKEVRIIARRLDVLERVVVEVAK